MRRRGGLIVGVAVLVALALPAPAEAGLQFVAQLTGRQEVPPNASPATGFGVFELNDAETELSFSITYSGLIGGNVVGAHFHNGVFGVNGPIVRHVQASLFGSPSGTVSGVWRATDPALNTTDPNRGPLTAALVAELKAHRVYFNIHTQQFPGGEIRGQLVTPEPASLTLLGAGAVALGGYALRRRKKPA